MYTFETNTATPPKIAPTTVRTSSATDISRTTAILNGQVNPNGTATNYWYEYGVNSDFGYATQFLATNSGITFMSVPTSISGLEPLTKYYFRLNAQNQFGTVNGAVFNFTSVGPANSTEPTITTSNATNISSSKATLVGRINPNGAPTTYWFEYSNDSLLGSLIDNGTPEKIISGTTTQNVQANLTTLKANTKYYYHLVGKNEFGTVSGDISSFTTKK
jgi:phosphodiesterase/alkaline phosphatase D-like protein